MAPGHPLPALRLTEPVAIILTSSNSHKIDGQPPVVCSDLSGGAGNGISCAVQTALGWRLRYLFCIVVFRVLTPCNPPLVVCMYMFETLSLRYVSETVCAAQQLFRPGDPLARCPALQYVPLSTVAPLMGDSGTALEAYRRCELSPFNPGQLRYAALYQQHQWNQNVLPRSFCRVWLPNHPPCHSFNSGDFRVEGCLAQRRTPSYLGSGQARGPLRLLSPSRSCRFPEGSIRPCMDGRLYFPPFLDKLPLVRCACANQLEILWRLESSKAGCGITRRRGVPGALAKAEVRDHARRRFSAGFARGVSAARTASSVLAALKVPATALPIRSVS